MTIFLICMIVLGVSCIGISHNTKESGFPLMFSIFGVVLIFAGAISLGLYLGNEFTYKESLKGNNPYKMEIRYELQDSIYIPKDTVFTKIEK